MRYDSPLRYPGGKASLKTLLARTVTSNGLQGCRYFEPFAGGAGAALALLREGVVSELRLNDLDPGVVAFWHTVLNDAGRFVDQISSVPLTIAEWKRQRCVYSLGPGAGTFELGFAAFYLNRCNRSGVLRSAGPIGGHSQGGTWKIGARFNRDGLAKRVLAINSRRDQIHVTNMDARLFLTRELPRGRERRSVFAYLDPPYHENSSRLYLNSYQDRDHKDLARYMRRQKTLQWIMSYDDSSLIWELYSSCVVSRFSVRYSLQRRKCANELLISPDHLKVPTDCLLPAVAEAGPRESSQRESADGS